MQTDDVAPADTAAGRMLARHLGCGKRAVADKIRAARALEREAGVPDTQSVILNATIVFKKNPMTDPADPRWEALEAMAAEAATVDDKTTAEIALAAMLAVTFDVYSDLEEAVAELDECDDEESVRLRTTIANLLPGVWAGLAQMRTARVPSFGPRSVPTGLLHRSPRVRERRRRRVRRRRMRSVTRGSPGRPSADDDPEPDAPLAHRQFAEAIR